MLEDVESADSDSNKEDSRENTIQSYKQIEAVDNEDVDSTDDQHQNSSQESQDESYVDPVNQEAPNKKRETVVAPHKKSKQIRSNKHALSEIASGLKALADSSVRQNQTMMEAERKREEQYLAFHKEKSEKIQERELRIVEILSCSCQQAKMLQPQQPVTSQIESQFLSYFMQTPTSSTRRESDPYQSQESPTSDLLGIVQNRTFFSY